MKLVHTVTSVREAVAHGKRVGFVPTMGALHAGHTALIKRSVAENDLTVLSVYVNPTQFDNPADLEKYPLTLEEDARIAGECGVDVLFAPSYAEIYPDAFRYRVDEIEFSGMLCGAHRPGHFTGVLTVVMKLLNIVRPHTAYFGEKDFQQLQLIRGMVDAFFLDVEVRGCATVREADGLAMSSRNVNLDADSRRTAPRMHELIASSQSDDQVMVQLASLGFDVDYVSSKNGRRYAAAKLGGVRLIDNVPREGSQ